MHHTKRPPRPNRPPPSNNNGFILLHGVPYLWGSLLDRNEFTQIDQTVIRPTSVEVDNKSHSMRSVIDININDLQRGSEDNRLSVMGNADQQRMLLQSISRHSRRLNGRLPVMGTSLLARVSYRIGTNRPKRTIRATTETLRLNDRHLSVLINNRDINNNSIISNYSDSIMSTITEFTNGLNRMIVTIDRVDLFYEVLGDARARRTDAIRLGHQGDTLDQFTTSGFDPMNHHNTFQSRHILPDQNLMGHCDCDSKFPSHMTPAHNPNWLWMNRFYRFDNMAQDIVLHDQEINDPSNRRTLVACGSLQVNRQFVVNPGSQLVFRFNVWKNDLVSVQNTQGVARALRLDVSQFIPSRPGHRPRRPIHRPMPPIWGGSGGNMLTSLIDLLADKRATSKLQSRELAELRRLVEELQYQINSGNDGGDEYPPDEDYGDDNYHDEECNCGSCECCQEEEYEEYPPDECECGECEYCISEGEYPIEEECTCGTCNVCCEPHPQLNVMTLERMSQLLTDAGIPELEF